LGSVGWGVVGGVEVGREGGRRRRSFALCTECEGKGFVNSSSPNLWLLPFLIRI